MLTEIFCDKLLEKRIAFNAGLNCLLGPDDAANSIGKSSVLMLIDFVLAGDDFPKLCADVIDNVGDIEVTGVFLFGKVKRSYKRSTANTAIVVKDGKFEISIQEYREDLKEIYLFPEDSCSFRDATWLFTRIWGKNNDNPNAPLLPVAGGMYQKVKKVMLSLFSLHHGVRTIEKNQMVLEKKKGALKSMFNEGFAKALNKKEEKFAREKIIEIEGEIANIKKNFEVYSVSVREVINRGNLELKKEKDILLDSIYMLSRRLQRIDGNLGQGNPINKKYFDKLKLYFPEVNVDRLNSVEGFHSGISKILKGELNKEKELIVEQMDDSGRKISVIDERIRGLAQSIERPVALIDRMLTISLEEKELKDQVRFGEINEKITMESKDLLKQLSRQIEIDLDKINEKINMIMSDYIDIFYENNPVAPKLQLAAGSYKFNHGNDVGTGKSYANMIALDLSVLSETYLPLVIHDSIVFKNIEVHATEKIIESYNSIGKQIFISIDEVTKYSRTAREILIKNSFLRLDSQRLAFGKSWKKN